MAVPSPSEVTRLLLDWNRGDRAALERLMPIVYDQLRRVAGERMRAERANHTLEPTALVNEVYLRLVDQKRARWHNRAQFFAVAARMMRRILVDHARGRAAKRRRGRPITLHEECLAAPPQTVDVLAVDDALDQLATLDPRKSRVVELRLFGGLTIAEAAAVLGVSPGTVKNDYRAARAWLRCRLERVADPV